MPKLKRDWLAIIVELIGIIIVTVSIFLELRSLEAGYRMGILLGCIIIAIGSLLYKKVLPGR